MNLLDKHKALLLSVLSTGTLVMSLFILDMKNDETQISESYYELQPEKTPEEKKLLEQLALNESTSQETNKAFNEANDYKEMMKNFKSLNTNDFDKTTKQTETEDIEEPQEVTDLKNAPTASEPSINSDELSSYSKINKVIAMRSAEKRKSAASNGDNSSNKTGVTNSANRNSSVSYSLKDRKDEHLPPPVYLCEENGKIVINISVNSSGVVTNTSVNKSASTSVNECLIDSALEYASDARFSSASAANQIGTITYVFVGKN